MLLLNNYVDNNPGIMKTRYIKSSVILLSMLFLAGVAGAQALLTTDDNGPSDPVESAALAIQSDNSGLIIPYVSLSYNDQGDIVANSITGTPADGLIIFHAGGNSVDKGLWYYDATLPGWILYSDFSSTLAERELDDFGEMYESNDIYAGTYYELSPDLYIPWTSASKGLAGSAFQFLDNEPVTTEAGTGSADQFMINGDDAVYSVIVSATLAASAPSTTVTGALYINNNRVAHVFFRHTFQLKDKPTSLNTSGNIEVKHGDRIDFRFTSDVKNKGLHIENLNLRLTEMGEL